MYNARNRLALSAGVSAIALVAMLAAEPARAQSLWTNPGSGGWGTAGNWNPVAVPNSAATAASILNGGTATVGGGNAFTVSTLTVGTGIPGDTSGLLIGDNSALTVASSIVNHATISVTNAGNASGLNLAAGATVSLTGGGLVVLGGTSNNSYIRDAALSTGKLINVDNTIAGRGHIGNGQMAMDNQAGGLVDANITGALLDVQPNIAGLTNEGILRATNGGTLGINGSSLGAIIQTGGTILASGAGSTAELYDGVTVSGGTLTSTGGGILKTATGAAATLNNVTLSTGSALTVSDNSVLQFHGTMLNQGTIALSSIGNVADLRFADGATLAGGGTITMAANQNNDRIFGVNNTGSETLTNLNNTIQGAGQVGASNLMEFINKAAGTINATSTTNTLTISPTTAAAVTTPNGGGFVNQGVLEATGSAGLILNAGHFNNLGGSIQAIGTSVVSGVTLANAVFLENGVTVSGGQLSTSGGGLIATKSGHAATLDATVVNGITLTGTYQAQDNSSTSINGAFANTGTILLSSIGNTTALQLGDATTLTGGGTISLSDQTGNRIYGVTNSGTEIATNVDNTIQGAGSLGASNSIGFINKAGGTVNATGTHPLTISPSGQSTVIAQLGAGFVNQGLLEATAAGGLVLNGGQYLNTGGTILASGASNNVSLQANAIVSGGLVTSTGGGLVTTSSGQTATFDGSSHGAVTLVGTVAVADNSILNLSGNVSNTGQIQVNSIGNIAQLLFANATTLSGGGSILLSDQTGNHLLGVNNSGTEVVTNLDNTISGAGSLGLSNSIEFLNKASGVVNATATHPLVISPTGQSAPVNANGGGFVNQGLLEATAAGGLVLNGGQFNNAGGTILASGAGNNVSLQASATISGGTLKSTGGGLVSVVAGNAATADGTSQGAISLAGTIVVHDNSTLNLNGSVINAGQIQVSSTGDVTQLLFANATTLSGGGSIVLSDQTNNHLFGVTNSGTEVVTNLDNTIQGAGQLGLSNSVEFINKAGGTINATGLTSLIVSPTGQSAVVTPNGGGFVNQGLLEATGNGGLMLNGGQFNNATGTIQAAGSGHGVYLANGVTVSGGLLQSTGGGLVTTAGGQSATLDGTSQGALTLAGTFAVHDNSSINLNGVIANTGQFQLASGGNTTDLKIANGTTLTGGGTLSLSNFAGNRIYGQQNSGTEVLTNLNNTIQGGGQIGISNGFGLDNSGTVSANVSMPLTMAMSPTSTIVSNGNTYHAGIVNEAGGVLQGAGGALIITSGAVENLGTVQAFNAGSVAYGASVTNLNANAGTLTGGTWAAIATGGGATVTATGGAITTNAATITLSGVGSTVQFSNLFTNVNVQSSLTGNTAAGVLNVLNNQSFSGPNALSNAGQINLGGGAFTEASLANSGTLNGFGTVTTSGSSPIANNNGIVTASGGTLVLTNGVSGNSASTVQTAGAATLDLSGGANNSTAGTLALSQGGGLALGTHTITVSGDYTNAQFGSGAGFNRHADVTGTGAINAAGTGDSLTLSGAAVNGGTLALGNVHTGVVSTGTYAINWAGTGAPVLRGAVAGSSGLTLSGATFGPIAPGSSSTQTIAVAAGAAGSLVNQSLTVTSNFDNIGARSMVVTGAAYDLANPAVAPNPVNFGNVHVGAVTNQALTISNGIVSNASFQEGLDASVSGTSTGVTSNGGTINNLAAGGVSNAISVGINTGTAGNKSGTATIAMTSDGATTSQLGTTSLNAATVQVNGAAYDLAHPTITPTIAFGAVHAGSSPAQQAITIANTVVSDAAFQEGLNASFGALGAGITTNGASLTNLAAGGSSTAMTVGISTSQVGTINGTAAIGLVSNGSTTSGLANTPLNGQSVAVTGTVWDLAKSNTIAPIAIVAHTGDGGGTVSQALSITNVVQHSAAFQEGLDSSFGGFAAGPANTLTPTLSGAITNLAAGATDGSSMKLSISTTAAGVLSGTVTVNQASNGATTSGLGITPLASQLVAASGAVTVGIFNYATATVNNAQPISLGAWRQGAAAATQAISISNTGPVSSLTEVLNGGVAATPAGFTTNGATFNGLAAGAVPNTGLTVGLDTTSAGAKSGNVVLGLVSDGTGIGGDGTTTQLPNQNVAVTGTVYRLASPALNTTAATLAARVGDALPAAPISITNTSADGFTEGLKTSLGTASAGFTAAGGTQTVAAAGTNTALSVGLASTATAGTTTGSVSVNFTSTAVNGEQGAPDQSLAGGTVSVTGKVYQTATASVAPQVDFGIVHVGDIVSKPIVIANTAPVSALNDTVTGSITGTTGPFTTGGATLGAGVAAGSSSNALTVGLVTTTAGVFTGGTAGGATLALSSHNADMTDLSLSTPSVTLSGTVDNYAAIGLANPTKGTLGGGGSAYTLNLGDIPQGSGTQSALLDLLNEATGPADLLSMGTNAFTVSNGTGFSIGLLAFAGLTAAGDQVSDLSVSFDTSTLGLLTETIQLKGVGSNASGWNSANGVLDPTLTITADVVTANSGVPEPASILSLLAGLAGIGGARWRVRFGQRSRRSVPSVRQVDK